MRRRENFFFGMALKSFAALVGIVGLMVVFARSFGELAIPAIHYMGLMMYLPMTTLVVGILGWLWTKRFDW